MKELLILAKESIQEDLFSEKTCDLTAYQATYSQKVGAFVTLTINKQLRGCIGRIVCDDPLYKTIYKMAKQAAFYDSRFTPLSTTEYPHINIELSILSQLTPVETMNDIILGTHGVVFTLGNYSSVFLPKVATQQGWTKVELLQQLALKAGLKQTSWQGAKLSIFTATSIM